MAMIEIAGTVNKVFYNDTAIEVIEEFKTKDGQETKRYYSVWMKEPTTLTMGRRVKVRGLFSAKIDEYEARDGQKKQKIAYSINNPVVTVEELPNLQSDPAPF